jgi:hypothetical protein
MARQRSAAAVRRTLAAILAAVTPIAGIAHAQSADPAVAVGPSPSSSRVHPLNGAFDARPLLATALERSPTIRRLVAPLDASDVIVYVALEDDVRTGSGDLHLMPAMPGVRRVLVRIDARNGIPERFKWLGHELQHAVEVASAPEVRDAAGMARLFARIGRLTAEGFETDAAVRAGNAVYREVFARAGRKAGEPLQDERSRQQ